MCDTSRKMKWLQHILCATYTRTYHEKKNDEEKKKKERRRSA